MGLFGGNTSGKQAGTQEALINAIAAQQANTGLQAAHDLGVSRYDKNYYDPWTSAGNNALSMYQNALGLNGASGNQAAQQAFQVSPGYDFQMGQGLQALDRSASAKGFLGSGNAATAATQYGQGLANQEYGNWLQRLGTLQGEGLQAAQGQTGRQGALANIDTWLGSGLSGNIMSAAKTGGDAMYNGQMADAASNNQGTANLFSALMGGANLASKFF
jgi:hypothetical protein